MVVSGVERIDFVKIRALTSYIWVEGLPSYIAPLDPHTGLQSPKPARPNLHGPMARMHLRRLRNDRNKLVRLTLMA